jgi:hypothetical protein
MLDISLMSFGATAVAQWKQEQSFIKYEAPKVLALREDALAKRKLIQEFINDKRAEKKGLENFTLDKQKLTEIRKEKLSTLRTQIEAKKKKEENRIWQVWHKGGTSIYGSEGRAKKALKKKYKKWLLAIPKLEEKLLKEERRLASSNKKLKLENEKKIEEVNKKLKELQAEKEAIAIPIMEAPIVSINYWLIILPAIFVSLWLSGVDGWRLESRRVLDFYITQQKTTLENQQVKPKEEQIEKPSLAEIWRNSERKLSLDELMERSGADRREAKQFLKGVLARS